MATETTSTVPAGTLPYSTRLVVDMILAAVQDTMSLYGHPALVDARPMAGLLDAPRGMTTAGTITVQINEAASAWDVAASETAYGTNKDIDPTYASFSTGNYDVAYGVSDDLRRRDATGLYNWPRIAQRIVTGWDVTFTGLVVALASSMTNSVGTTCRKPEANQSIGLSTSGSSKNTNTPSRGGNFIADRRKGLCSRQRSGI